MEPPENHDPEGMRGNLETRRVYGLPINPTLEKISYVNRLASSSIVIPTAQDRENVVARHTTNNGITMIIFKAKDYYGVMEHDCRKTIVSKFLKPRPQIDKVRITLSLVQLEICQATYKPCWHRWPWMQPQKAKQYPVLRR
ncbi:hypothetical protein HAX54_006574 [Datura stramonium]|uniref:Uncharacterized protein n=1 Tax=Datura stramonium TaxID=4076 RepID=A0ABS8TBX0_DATST|nr:hypothetical protein [Datura stramonium]